MTPDKDTDGWAEWKNYVLEGQKETNKKLDALLVHVQKLEVEVTAIKIKSGLFGTVAGLAGATLIMLAKTYMGAS